MIFIFETFLKSTIRKAIYSKNVYKKFKVETKEWNKVIDNIRRLSERAKFRFK